MKAIIAGIPGAGKTTILNEVVRKCNIKVINYGDVMFEIAKKDGIVNNRDELRKLPFEKQKELQKKAAEIISKEENIIIDTHCTIKTSYGYMAGLPYDILKVLKPDRIILIEAEPKEIIKRRNKDKEIRIRDIESMEEIELHQEMNRMSAMSCASFINATVKIIKNKEGKIKEAVEEILKVLI